MSLDCFPELFVISPHFPVNYFIYRFTHLTMAFRCSARFILVVKKIVVSLGSFYKKFLQNAEEKLAEINKARNESVDALKNHREEFAMLRKRIHDNMNEMKECEEMKIQKKTEYEQMLSVINEDKTRLENELSRLKR